MKMWIDQHLGHGLDRVKKESIQLADALRTLVSEPKFRLGDNSWIEDRSHIFRALYYRYIFKYIQCLFALLTCQEHLNFELVHLADLESHEIYSETNTGEWWSDMQDGLTAGAMIVIVICTLDMTHLTDVLGDQDAWPL